MDKFDVLLIKESIDNLAAVASDHSHDIIYLGAIPLVAVFAGAVLAYLFQRHFERKKKNDASNEALRVFIETVSVNIALLITFRDSFLVDRRDDMAEIRHHAGGYEVDQPPTEEQLDEWKTKIFPLFKPKAVEKGATPLDGVLSKWSTLRHAPIPVEKVHFTVSTHPDIIRLAYLAQGYVDIVDQTILDRKVAQTRTASTAGAQWGPEYKSMGILYEFIRIRENMYDSVQQAIGILHGLNIIAGEAYADIFRLPSPYSPPRETRSRIPPVTVCEHWLGPTVLAVATANW